MRKLFSIFAALTLSVGLWAETVPYIDATGASKTADATEITNSSATLAAGWYVVKGTNVTTNTLVCNGAVNIILADGAKLTATGGDDDPGIKVSGEGNSLTIYAQSAGDQMGQLKATGGHDGAGIGGGAGGIGSYITINGGIVEATGGRDGAGIGGGDMGSGSNITINGGIVMATGKGFAAGIGGGDGRKGLNITINGGMVTATGADGAAGIGGGQFAGGENITINGGTVTAKGGSSAAGIGDGEATSSPSSDIFVATKCIVKADGNNPPTTVITNTGADLASSLSGKQYVTIEPVLPVSTSYINENGETKNIDAWEVKNASEQVTWGTASTTTWYVVKGTDVTLSKGAVCAGDVRLILADNAKLTATGASNKAGIEVSGEGNSLTIYGYTNQSGQLIATGGMDAAGIGGGNNGSGSNITINGGVIEATGGEYGSGIGGGELGSGSNITINGGIITTAGGEHAAGIGGGDGGSGSNITINGGTVNATGGDDAAGIGGGDSDSGSNITINGGKVNAAGGRNAAGIGGGFDGSAVNITINGGEVTANGGDMAAGIGGGYDAVCSDIYISDAYILNVGYNQYNNEVIAHSSATDMANALKENGYVKIEGLATPYTRSMTIDNWATVCLPYAATGFSGAKFYRVNYHNTTESNLYIEEVSSLEAGMPYIFQATAETVTIEHAGVATLTYGEEQTDSGLHGSFARTIIATDGSQAALSNNAVQWLDPDLEITVPACRAYFDMTEVPTTEQSHSAPLRCIRVPRQTPTDFENVTLDEDATKILRNGQLIIIRDGKEYNAQGMQL